MTTTSESVIPHLRTSERKDFKRCQQRWVWAWRKGLIPVAEKPGALWFGIGMHLALQERYKYRGTRRGKNVLKVWRDYVGDEQGVVYTDEYENDPEAFFDAKELGEIMLGEYLDHYGKDERWFVLSAEQTFEIPIPYPRRMNRDGTLVYYNGTFDLVAMDQESEYGDSLWLWDHKNVKQIQTHHLSLDEQAGSYWAFAGDVLAHQGLIEPGMKLDGILYNFLRKGKPDPRPRDEEGRYRNKPTKQHYADALAEAGLSQVGTLPQLTERAETAGLTVYGDISSRQPPPLFHREVVWRTSGERRTQVRRIQEEALQMQAIRDRTLLPVKNPTKDCAWDCPFFNLCEMHEAGDDWREFMATAYRKRDPYADHRKATTE